MWIKCVALMSDRLVSQGNASTHFYSKSMIIANPLYDVVFKYLLEDVEIARELLSTILGEEILSLELKPQETATENLAANISILRVDFKAHIQKADGTQSKVLIELQKAKQAFDVMRFRRYLGDNYRKEDEVRSEQGAIELRPLPIVTIYFLGFSLDSIEPAVLKVNREYKNAVNGDAIHAREPFIELLTHDSYLIQVKKLAGNAQTRLERVLQVFSPAYQTSDKHQLDFQGNTDEPLVRKMVARLGRAIASDEVRNVMDVEDEIERSFDREAQKYLSIIALTKQEVEEERYKTEAALLMAEEERQKAKEAQQKAEDAQRKADTSAQEILALKRQLEEIMRRLDS